MTKAELEELRSRAEDLSRLSERILELESLAERTTAMLDGLPRSSSYRAALEEYALRLTEAREQYARMADELYWKRTEALIGIIEGVSDSTGRKALIARYIDLKEWRAIARELGYSMNHCMRKYKAALRELELEGGMPT